MQADTNLDFWRWALPRSMTRLREAAGGLELDAGEWLVWLDEARAELRAVVPRGLAMSLGGIVPPAATIVSSRAIEALLEDRDVRAFHDAFAVAVEERHGAFSSYDVVSFGVTSSAELPHVAAMAARARRAGALTVIGRHSYENFSLTLVWDAVLETGGLLRWVDAVVHHDERIDEALSSLCARAQGAAGPLQNCAVQVNGGLVDHPPTNDPPSSAQACDASYVTRLDWPSESILCQIELVGNRCYYGRCTFCAQIEKHLTNRFLPEAASVDASVGSLTSLHRDAGVRRFSFLDEALRPADLRRFCAAVTTRELPIRWIGRGIADPKLKPDLVEAMASAGCIEFLFGLETIDPRLAAAMGKVSRHAGAEHVLELISRFDEQGIDLVLSMIHGFPGEDEHAWQTMWDFYDRVRAQSDNVTWIFNRFVLFGGTAIHRDPVRFSIRRVGRRLPDNDLQMAFNYQGPSGISGFSTKLPDRSLGALRWGVTASEMAEVEAIAGDLLEEMSVIDYGSFGIAYRDDRRRFLRHDLVERLLAGERRHPPSGHG